jgi:phospholipase/lecithinase/hemolysin
MKSVVMAVCVAVFGTSVTAAPVNLSDTYSSFVTFGDSLSDDGKFDDTPFEPGLPSLGGRFSNGLVFAELLAQDFVDSFNLAIGGATARNANENPLPPNFATFAGQVASFVASVADPFASAAIGDRPLFSVLFGANDILQNIGLPDGNSQGPGNVLPGIGVLAADDVEANIRAVKAIDANYNDFIVMNLPDLSQTALFQNPLFGVGALTPLAALESAGFNARLAQNIDALQNDGFNIIEFDLASAFQDYIVQAGLLGIDTLTPCTFDLSNPGPESTCVFAPGEPDNTDLSLADNFLFVDGIHPNRLAHAAFADQVRAAAAPTPVPLPASFGFLLAGVAAFGAVRGRKLA